MSLSTRKEPLVSYQTKNATLDVRARDDMHSGLNVDKVECNVGKLTLTMGRSQDGKSP
jgi:hypothetical protein